jgi:hypothetical protein
MRFEIAAEPIEEFRTPAILWDFYGIVDAYEASPAIHLLFQPRKVGERWVSTSTVGVNDNCVRLVQQAIVLGPTISQHRALHVWVGVFDYLRKYFRTCKVFVGSIVMALAARDEYDLFLSVLFFSILAASSGWQARRLETKGCES